MDKHDQPLSERKKCCIQRIAAVSINKVFCLFVRSNEAIASLVDYQKQEKKHQQKITMKL